MATKWICRLAGVVGWIAALQPAQAAVEFQVRSETEVVGRAEELGVRFAARSSDAGLIDVVVELPTGETFEAMIDYANGQLVLRTAIGRGGPAAELGSTGIEAAHAVLAQLDPSTSAAEATLARALNFLAAARPGMALDVVHEFDPAELQAKVKAMASLCSSTGKQVKATYDTEEGTLSERARLGPCYNEQNDCLGRCGIGCGVLGSKTQQQFTQDCLNHDVCRLRTGANATPPCDDEFLAASDDFFLARDCALFDGTWTDNFGYRWKVTQGVGGQIFGTVRTGSGQSCRKALVYRVTGVHEEEEIRRLRASLVSVPQGCCRSFVYDGTYGGCSAVTGTWENSCNSDGSFSMRRAKAAGASALEGGDGQQPGPADEGGPD